ncbi:MAG TPA: hypothetical protein EYP10_10345 [Armatimonadetes bacterium]|nr:hypothetical protein [Armatimonadota bacterium]
MEGVNTWTFGDQSDGVEVHTSGNYSDGVYVSTSGGNSEGVYAVTHGYDTRGVYVATYGTYSNGVHAYSAKGYAIHADTDNANTGGNYAFHTYDNIYIGGKSNLVGPVDPIIVERFNADPAMNYEVGDVVCMDEDSHYVKPCTKADDTRVVGVVGPTLEIEDGEISVVIMGYRGARPDEEHVKVLEMRLSDAEVMMAESVTERKRLDDEVTMLISEIEEAKSVTRQVVSVKADAGFAPIKRGDLLTTSPTTGHAMKAQPVDLSGVEIYRPGTLIGKAMEPLDSGTGMIEAFVTLQ